MIRRIFVISAALILTACSTCGFPESSIKKIKPGMSIDQVGMLLGSPTRIEHTEATGLQGDVYYYSASNGEGKVVFFNNTVFKAEFVPGAKS
jgi:outer membrane protein assembly factor BamE (lipoprotein component of BamABCDE complex)